MTAMICRVGVLVPDGHIGDVDLEDRDKWHVFVDDTVITKGLQVHGHAKKLHYFDDGRYRDCGVVVDASSLWTYKDSHMRTRHEGRDYEQFGFSVRGPRIIKGKWKNPRRSDGSGMIKRLLEEKRLLVNDSTCANLISSFEELLDAGNGEYMSSKQRPGGKQDRRASAMDSVRYLVDAMLHITIGGAHKRASKKNPYQSLGY